MIIFIGEYPRKKAHFVYPRSGLNKEQLDAPASDSAGREAERLAVLDHLNAIRPETDHILPGLVGRAARGIGRIQTRRPRAQHVPVRGGQRDSARRDRLLGY